MFQKTLSAVGIKTPILQTESRDFLQIDVDKTPDTFLNRTLDTIDRITKAPARIRDGADAVNDFLIEKARIAQRYGERLAGGAGQIAEKNLTGNKIEGFTVKAGRWIRKNPAVSIGAGVLVVFLILKGLVK